VLKVRSTLIAVVFVIALAIPTTAFAQGSDATSAQYEAADELAVGAAGGGGSADGGDGGLDGRVVSGLPFTGFDLLAMGLAAVVITGTGFALRRLSRPPQPRQ
jgi:hypothetical protein